MSSLRRLLEIVELENELFDLEEGGNALFEI